MVTQVATHDDARRRFGLTFCLLLLGLILLLMGCEPSGDSDTLSTPITPGSRVEQQAVDNLLQLYGQALQHEDIDRLQALFQPEPDADATAPQATHGPFPAVAAQ